MDWRKSADDLFNELQNERRRSEAFEAENKELKSLCQWSMRRLPKVHKEFAYNEYDEITGEKVERD